MFDTTVSQPALKFTAVLENDPIRNFTSEVKNKVMNPYAQFGLKVLDSTLIKFITVNSGLCIN